VLDLYFMTSPNVYKAVIALEELELEYRLIPVDLAKREHLVPANIGGSIAGKVPVLVDHDEPGRPVMIFESGAILQYLAEKHGELLPSGFFDRTEVMQWLFWQVGGLGPFGGQCFHFRAPARVLASEIDHAYSTSRYEHIFEELWTVMERRLGERDYLAGTYSIADIACFPWIDYLGPASGRAAFPNIARWHAAVGERPAVRRAYERSRAVDTGYEHNEIGSVIYTADELRAVITL
jgi:GSH-dependent disulfide-bond oxidoreductase